MAEVNSDIQSLIDIRYTHTHTQPTVPHSQWPFAFCLSLWPTLERVSDSSCSEVGDLRQEGPPKSSKFSYRNKYSNDFFVCDWWTTTLLIGRTGGYVLGTYLLQGILLPLTLHELLYIVQQIQL